MNMNNIYHWMMINAPYWIMYKYTYIDTQHKMWVPRWGFSKRQSEEAEKQAKDLMSKMNWK